VRTYDLDPLEFGLKTAHISELLGGDALTNAHILRGVLSGEVDSAKYDVVLLNAAAALVAAGKTPSFQDGMALAQEVIDSGAALAKLDALIAYSQELAAHG
jgi:anthranilate phosphoribosyltransferase